MNSAIKFFIFVLFAINGEGMASAGRARAPGGEAYNELADQGHNEKGFQYLKNAEDKPSSRSNKAPGTMTTEKKHATLDLHVATTKPEIPSKDMLSDLQRELQGTGYIVEHFDQDRGIVTLRDTTLNRTNATTPTKNKEPSSLKINTPTYNGTPNQRATSKTQWNTSTCPNFETLKNHSIAIWTGLQRAHGVKEGFDVIVNATQITLASIVDCATKMFSNVGTWLKHSGPKSRTRNASATVSPSPTTKATTAPKDFKTKTIESSGTIGPRGTLNTNPLDGLDHDTKEANPKVEIFHNPAEHKNLEPLVPLFS